MSRGVSFKQAAKNPRLWKAMSMKMSQEQAFAEQTAAGISDSDLADLAEYFIFEIAHEDDAWLAGRTLQQVNHTRLRNLFEPILTNPANAGRLVKSRDNDSSCDRETPVERICGLMDDGTCPESLAEFAGNLDESIRKAAVLAICATGGLDMVPIFEKASMDADQYVRSYALMGLDRAMKSSRLDPAAAPLLYPHLLRLVQQGHNCSEATKLLMGMEPRRAESDLQSAEILNPDFPALYEVLPHFGGDALPSREKLEELFRAIEPRPRKYADNCSLGEVLRLIGHHRSPQDEGRFTFYMGEEDEEVAEGAASGWLAFHGLERAHTVAFVWDAPASTPVPLQQYRAIYMMDSQVRNGGFSQYFFNSHGDAWALALSGLEEAGSSERLSLLKQALAKIAGGKPSLNREARGHELAKVLKKDEDAFGSLETRYYDSKEHLAVLMAKLVMKHQAVFRSEIESSRVPAPDPSDRTE